MSDNRLPSREQDSPTPEDLPPLAIRRKRPSVGKQTFGSEPSKDATPVASSAKSQLHISKSEPAVPSMSGDKAMEKKIEKMRSISAESEARRISLQAEIKASDQGRSKEAAAVLVDATIDSVRKQTALNDLELQDMNKNLTNILKRKREVSQEFLDEKHAKFDELLDQSVNLNRSLSNLTRDRDDLLHQLSQVDGDQCRAIYTNLLTHSVQAARMKRPSQSKWRQESFEYYNCVNPENEEEVWCPVLSTFYARIPSTRPWLSASDVSAAHIIPYDLRANVVNWIFGLDGDQDENQIIFSKRNCIPLAKPIERGFDRGYFAIIPVPGTYDPDRIEHNANDNQEQPQRTEFMCILLDNSVRNQNMGILPFTWDVIDGLHLTWKGNTRPRKGFLYLRWAINYLAAENAPFKDFNQLDLPARGRAWLTPKKYLRHSPFVTITHIMGDHHLLPLLEAGTFEDSASDTHRGRFAFDATRELLREVNKRRKTGTIGDSDLEDTDEEEEYDD